jgi:hypothetical protein
VLFADARSNELKRAVRVQQYTALLLMQQLQCCEFDSDTNPAICWIDLQEREFIDLTADQQKQLPKAISILRLLLLERNATDAQMHGALDETKYSEYKNSFNYSVSHVEDEWDNRPSEIDEYLRLVKLGDFLNGSADRVARRAAVSAYGKRYDSKGQPTSTRLRNKAEKYYEDALMYLRGECEDLGQAGMLQRWFDRSLDFDMNTTTLSADVVGIPRLRGSTSKHCLDKTRNLWGATKAKHYRQREAITECVYAMLFVDEVVEVAAVDIKMKLQRLLRDIVPERDWD